MDAAPVEIVIQKTERHDVRQQAIERVARQLAAADGKDPDGNIQCGEPSAQSMTVTCTLLALPYPRGMVWYAYRDKAEKMLKDAFK